MGEIPHLKELVELHKDKPFAIVGVNTDADDKTYRAGVAEHGVTWRSARGADDVVEQYAVQYYPTIYVLDAEGRIRFKDARGE
ncbi:MAG: TlpA disulfide reductase family protein, partial [Planctomycetota bacterium]|nr:TlpA disulfide reductase family protein [Planctomycetota bacterium]